MAFEYRIDEDRGIIYSEWSGHLNLLDLMMCMTRVLNDPEFSPEFHSIAFLNRNFSMSQFYIQEQQELADLLQRYSERGGGTKWAIVTTEAFLREVVKYNLSETNFLSIQIRFFMTEEEAIAWIEG